MTYASFFSRSTNRALTSPKTPNKRTLHSRINRGQISLTLAKCFPILLQIQTSKFPTVF